MGERAKRMPAEKQCADDFVPGARPVPEPPIRLSRDADGVFWTARRHGSYRRKESLPLQPATWSSSRGVRVRYRPAAHQGDVVYGRTELVPRAASARCMAYDVRAAISAKVEVKACLGGLERSKMHSVSIIYTQNGDALP